MHPLTGVRVIDFTRVLAGPFCTMNLADMGADVIKVESTRGGDDTRAWGPPFVGGESAYFLCVNRNKRSIAVDLKTEEGRRIAQGLIARADVVVHNFLPRSAEKLGLLYDQVKMVNPDVIYCSISGFGNRENVPGYDYILQAIGGLMSITGEPDGDPMKVGVAITDLFTGLYAAVAILNALIHRMRSGVGQEIDIALYDAQIAMLSNVASNVLVSGQDARRLGNAHPNIVPYQTFKTRDGQVVIAVGNDSQFHAFCRALDLESVADHPDYATNDRRVENRGRLIPLLEQHLRTFSTDEVLGRLRPAGVSCGPVRSVGEALSAPETAMRNMLWTVQHSTAGDLTLVGSPLKLAATPARNHLPPPRLGEHTREILRAQGYLEEDIKWLEQKGVVFAC
ncbi:MAG: CoA transferase [Alicyclobacillus macrosporangiidus]|uniref:CaiB/BaiF CoA transferase family protein n=1 Tax=Alicyclobacillus macrosporangiidus TaxID=392015 RepID=UPI0026EFAB6E|nr:CoA transferase [Alicyclobacillus macrosporangiidus]MCL6599874.1 CoA transferase [Alicyclobacillus macrosporangiidus]